jgi:alkylation response protein AidB-like acyl-CoA dehydrogenase
MDFADSPEHAAFRSEIRRWLETNLPSEICVDDATDQRVAPDREPLEKRIQWQKTMNAAGWVGISWPKEYGGRSANFMQQVILDEEYTRARAPILPGASGLNLLGPSLIHWGTEEQKQRHLLRTLNADELWCQGFFEPDPGGDLASLRTRRRPRRRFRRQWPEGVDFGRAFCRLVLSTGAHRPRRTQAPRHQLPTGRHEDTRDHGAAAGAAEWPPPFQRSVFVDVPVPKANLVGPLNEGWKVAITTLMFERSGAGGRDHAAQIARLIELAKQLPTRQEPAWNETHIRQQLAQLAIEAKALQVTRLRGLTRRLRGEPPGPEGSILKLFGSELGVRIFASTLLGPYAMVDAPTEVVPDTSRWFHRVLGARQHAIAGGTSEIQRNIIGERVLGLPKG